MRVKVGLYQYLRGSDWRRDHERVILDSALISEVCSCFGHAVSEVIQCFYRLKEDVFIHSFLSSGPVWMCSILQRPVQLDRKVSPFICVEVYKS